MAAMPCPALPCRYPAQFVTTDRQIPMGSVREAGVIGPVLGRRVDSLRAQSGLVYRVGW